MFCKSVRTPANTKQHEKTCLFQLGNGKRKNHCDHYQMNVCRRFGVASNSLQQYGRESSPCHTFLLAAGRADACSGTDVGHGHLSSAIEARGGAQLSTHARHGCASIRGGTTVHHEHPTWHSAVDETPPLILRTGSTSNPLHPSSGPGCGALHHE